MNAVTEISTTKPPLLLLKCYHRCLLACLLAAITIADPSGKIIFAPVLSFNLSIIKSTNPTPHQSNSNFQDMQINK